MSGWYMPSSSDCWHWFPGDCFQSGFGLSLCGVMDDLGLGKVNAPDCVECAAKLAVEDPQSPVKIQH